MNKTKILILTEVPLSKRDYERFGIEILSSHFELILLDCTPLLNSEFWKKYSELTYEFQGYYVIKDWASLENILIRSSGAIAIDYLGDGSNAVSIRQQLLKNEISRTLVRCGLVPQPVGVGKLKRRFRQGNWIPRIYHKLKRELLAKYKTTEHKPDYVILSAQSGLEDKKIQGARHYILAHSFDYDEYLRIKETKPVEGERYAVFLDSDFIYHQEYMITGEKRVVTEARYYPSINKFFDQFERVTGLKVIIAAHPRSRYDLRPKLYSQRIPLLGQTADLVRNSQLVMTVQSTAISYAILWKKPIIFLNTDEYEVSDHSIFLYEFASKTQSKILNIDSFSEDELDLEVLMMLNDNAYADYKERYIKFSNSPDLPIWVIFSQYIREAVKE